VGLNEDVAAYAQELADAAGITDATARDTFIKNDKIQAKVRTSIEATLREKGRADKATSEAQRIYEENLKIFANNKAAVEAAEKRVQSYVEKFGELPGGGDPDDPNARRAAVGDIIDKKTFDERIKVTEGNTIGLVKSVAKITAKHLKDFNEEPDLDAIEKLAVEQSLTAEKAYAEWRKPKDEARAKEQQEAALKKAREEGELEGRSKIAAGAITSAEPASPFMANLRKGEAMKDGPKDSFIKGWRESAQATQKGTGT